MPFLICIIIALFLFPFVRLLFKRISCMAKIKKLCVKKNYHLHPTHLFWFFGSKHIRKCDLYIETDNQVFAVKLFGMPRRRTILVFQENGKYIIRSFIAFAPYGSAIQYPIDSKSKHLPQYDFRHKYRDEWEVKTPRRVLLVNPVSMEFKRQPHHGSEVIVGAGDIVNGMEIDSLPRLLGDLESAL